MVESSGNTTKQVKYIWGRVDMNWPVEKESTKEDCCHTALLQSTSEQGALALQGRLMGQGSGVNRAFCLAPFSPDFSWYVNVNNSKKYCANMLSYKTWHLIKLRENTPLNCCNANKNSGAVNYFPLRPGGRQKVTKTTVKFNECQTWLSKCKTKITKQWDGSCSIQAIVKQSYLQSFKKRCVHLWLV